ncbi:hypothetical protein KPH14_000787 [Odynerus spinipes]|uniref:Uncharacterized protein n=1 Tax=Odynerus spinipes TaxID=1348599 RepID=A0AAD9RDA4_9HYME|nr:hypothetical protein KPH14_000787 [Odynerus spinipes]
MTIVEIATYIATNIYNDGYNNILLMLHELNITIGRDCQEMCNDEDEHRILLAEKRAQEATKEVRTALRKSRLSLEGQQLAEEGPLYGAGIAD